MVATKDERVEDHRGSESCRHWAWCVAASVCHLAWLLLVVVSATMNARAATNATTVSDAQTPAGTGESPWLFVPLVSSDPKLGTSLGALAAYLHKFDPVSSVSMFGAGGLYASTYSKIGAMFAQTYFGEDHHRLIVFGGGGQINNDYKDFLGTGFPLSTEDRLKAFAARFDSVAVGAVVRYDSRDDQNSPSRGWFLDINNQTYHESLGGSVRFDSCRLKLQGYWPHGDGHVLAARFANQWDGGGAAGRLRLHPAARLHVRPIARQERVVA